MNETYRIHFGYSKKSKYYPQAVELAHFAYKHEIVGEGDDSWHIVILTEEQVDLMASLYLVAVKVPFPKIYGADIQYTQAYCLTGGTYDYFHASDAYKKRVYFAVDILQRETGKSMTELADYIQEKYLNPIYEDMFKVREKLSRESRIYNIDPNTQTWVKAQNKPQEPIKIYKQIREFIGSGKYVDAVTAYYLSLGKKHYGELTNELIYLKRLAMIHLSGRDLFYFKTESSRDGIIASNPDEYVACINETVARLQEMGRKSPLDILLEYAPTMQEMIEKRQYDWHMGVYLWHGEFKRDSTPVTMDKFSAMYDSCPEGRLFDRYPDQVQHCRVIEYSRDPKYLGLWTTYPPSYYQTEILDKGFHLDGIEVYYPKSWRELRGEWRRETEFISLKSLDEVFKLDYGSHGIEYTGRNHQLEGQIFYEINLIRNQENGIDLGNPFLEIVYEVLREAENTLRVKHGIPRIGEGWVSETYLYRMLLNIFSDAVQHATPEWLRPQHLDVFVPSRKLAFEYQGKQHYEPIDFFGGQESFESTVKRDELKAIKCKSNGVTLIHWHYTEPINQPMLEEKLKQSEANQYELWFL